MRGTTKPTGRLRPAVLVLVALLLAACGSTSPSASPSSSAEASAVVEPSPTGGESGEPSGEATEEPSGEASEAPTEEPTAAPTPTPTAAPTSTPTPTPTPRPTATPTPTPAPTPTPPAAQAPTVARLTAAPDPVYNQGKAYCPTKPGRIIISVTASHPSGLASVTLFTKAPRASTFTQTRMSTSGGNVWTATLDAAKAKLAPSGRVQYLVKATAAGSGGRTTRFPRSGSQTFVVKVCANLPPKVPKGSANVSPIYADPFGQCPTRPTSAILTVRPVDTDGIRSAVLYYKGPNAKTYASKPMKASGAAWRATLATTAKSLSISGPVRWYALVTDKRGLSAKSPTAVFAVVRCDAPTVFGNSTGDPTAMFVPGRASDVATVSDIRDRDGIDKAYLKWTVFRIDPLGEPVPTGDTKTIRLKQDKSAAGVWHATIPKEDAELWLEGFPVGTVGFVGWTLEVLDKTGVTLESGLYRGVDLTRSDVTPR
jgi:outer membrane biosynthesis protein TonB